MSRNTADFHNSILFHGSNVMIPEGSIVEARNGGNAYATTNEDLAHNYALVKGKGKGFVHQVEPLKGDTSLFVAGSSHSSQKGFKVVGVKEARKPTNG
jgi:hypothetical protein